MNINKVSDVDRRIDGEANADIYVKEGHHENIYNNKYMNNTVVRAVLGHTSTTKQSIGLVLPKLKIDTPEPPPKTPTIEDFDLTDNEFSLISKYFSSVQDDGHDEGMSNINVKEGKDCEQRELPE